MDDRMTSVCFPVQHKEKQTGYPNDPYERVTSPAQTIINTSLTAFETLLGEAANENERMALRRAFARYIIDSGIASERGWL